MTQTKTAPTPGATPTVAIALTIFAGFILAGMDAMAKTLGNLGVPLLMVLWGRYFFNTVITFGGYSAKYRSLRFLRANRPLLQFLRAGSLFCATSSFYLSLTEMPLGDAAAIQFLAPVLVTAISGLFLGERVGPRRWAAVVCAFTGVLLIARPGGGAYGLWALLPLATAHLLAVYMILTRIIGSHDAAETTTFYTTAVGAIALTLSLPYVWTPLTPVEWGLMVGMGLVGAIGHGSLVKAFRVAEASALAPFMYSQIVGAIVLGAIVFGDWPTIWTYLGATLIVGSGVYVWYRETTVLRRAR